MKTFDFYVDQKVSAWYRTKFEVEAETYEDARKIAKEQFLNGAIENEAWEIIEGTEELLDAEENGKQATAELYSETNGILLSNEY